MKKLFAIFTVLLILQVCSFAKDTLQFDFPNNGWHQVASPDGVSSKKCYVPYNQNADSYTEMLIFYERVLKSNNIAPLSILHRQLGKDRNNYIDIIPEYISQDLDDAMVTWCSKLKNTCAVERAFQGKDGVIIAIYLNKAPHYSQNMFGQWSNILKNIKLYDNTASTGHGSIIELD